MPFSATPIAWVDADAVTTSTTADLSAQDALVTATVQRYAAEFEAAIGRPVSVEVTDEEAELLGPILVTRYRPVVSVEDISDTGDYTLARGVIQFLDTAAATLGSTPATITVSYTATFDPHSLAAARSAVAARSLRFILRDLDDATGVTSVSEEGHSDNYMEDAWTTAELATIESMRKRVGAS